ncbi:MAG: 2Fe-2S iron-sulfur cluster-binding protein, partial [Actinomycetota bacterium]|nr:2Fe-2S iron-sulfur cluster-binding protein [Actinomycetota bacterium]
ESSAISEIANHRTESADADRSTIQFVVDGAQVEAPDDGASLLGVLRDHLGVRVVKDGCSPQGQCGCCTVLVDGAPRVACVTPVRRVKGREVVTAAGLESDERKRWGDAFVAVGASQCGFCTPGIVCRLVGHERRGADLSDKVTVDKALAAHQCRCTGWQTIGEAVAVAISGREFSSRDLDAAARRAALETGGPQAVGASIVLGDSQFADDTAPPEALVAVRDGETWMVAPTLHEARQRAGKVQGRRTTLDPSPPLDLPDGDWAVSLRTTWVEPAYLETDASWCEPGGSPSDPLANGGAFGAKLASEVAEVARRLADEQGRPVRALWSREDTVRYGAKRPPIAAGLDADGQGIVRVASTPGIAAVIGGRLPGCRVEEVELLGPPTSSSLRAAGWAEAEMLLAALSGSVDWVRSPEGGAARATVDDSGIVVELDAGNPLDVVMLRSYAIGAAHMAWSWITSESLVVDDAGEVHDLTMRSFGVVRSAEMPRVTVEIGGSGPAVAVGDAVFAAVSAATWLQRGAPTDLPTGGS